MDEFPDNLHSEISTFEDLDPEPPGRAHRWRALEFLVGVLLVAGVFGWVGSDWIGQQIKGSEYHAAEQAAAQEDWDTAQRHYLSAGNYRDAPARSTEIGRLITERNQHYAVALLAGSMGQWAVSLQAAQAVHGIQPGFRDAEQLVQTAENEVYREALSGTVALRTRASPPGLYLHTADNWLWLKGSDENSKVWGFGAPSHILYDVRGPNWNGITPRNNQGDIRTDPGTPALKGRQLMGAHISAGGVTFTNLAFDPEDYNLFVWGEKGVWGLRWKAGNAPSGDLVPYSWYGQFEVYYEAWAQPMVIKIALPSTSWAIMDLSPQGDHVLLAQFPAGGEINPVTRLYLADADGGNPRLVYTYPGIIMKAVFSPNGHYALATADLGVPNIYMSTRTRAIVLVDLTGQTQPSTVLQKSTGQPCYELECNLPGAIFLTQGQLTGTILLADWGRADQPNVFSLRDPARPAQDLATAQVDGVLPRFSGAVWVAQGEAGARAVVMWTDPLKSQVALVILEPGRSSVVAHINQANVNDPLWTIARQDRLILYSRPDNGDVQTGKFAVSSLSLSDVTDNSRATETYSGTLPRFASYSLSSQWYPGQELLAYTVNGEVHARTYDGTVDVPLESGVDAFYYLPFWEAMSLR